MYGMPDRRPLQIGGQGHGMKLILEGILEWTVAIAAFAGTIALFTWLAVLFFRKDTRDDSTRNSH
jgi:hypothetical protein